MLSKIYDEILSFFPDNLNEIKNIKNEDVWEKAEEIRVRNGQAIIIKSLDNEIFLNNKLGTLEMIRLMESFCNNSIYAVQNEINSGYITLKGGHRVGISGMGVIENGKIKNIKYISSLNIRIAREVKDCSKNALRKILKNNFFENTLIISPPGVGKTTMLRDMIRNLSNGFENVKGENISLVDERMEIAAMYKGMPQNEVGIRTDVMCNLPKSLGIKMMIRSMAPKIIATDEIGSKEDFEAIKEASLMGVKLLFTMHGRDIEDISEEFIKSSIFKNIVVLTKKQKVGEILKIYKLEDKKYVINN